MNCKFCNAEMLEAGSFCPVCGKNNNEEEETKTSKKPKLWVINEEEETKTSKKPKLWVIIVAAVGALVLLAVLVIAILYGCGVDVFAPKQELAYDIMQKPSYTISDVEESQKAADVVVAVAGEVELTNSELQVYYWQTVSDYINNYYSYLTILGLDISQPMENQIYDPETGLTWQQFFLDNAIQSWHRYTVLGLQAKEEGFEVEEETKTYIEGIPAEMQEMAEYYGYANPEEMLAKDISHVCTLEGYISYVTANIIGMEYFESLYDTLYPSDSDVEAYYNENEATFNMNGISKEDDGKYVDVRHVLLEPTEVEKDENGEDKLDERGFPVYTEAAWEACREKAEQLYADWLAGGATEDSFAQMAAAHSTDAASGVNGGLYTQVVAGNMTEAFDTWCFDETRVKGDHGVIKTEYGYHIMYFVGIEDIWMSAAREELLTVRASEIVEAGLEKWPIVISYDKIVVGESAE